MVHRIEVVLPLRIHDVEHDVALLNAHQLGTDLFFFFCVTRRDGLLEQRRHLFSAKLFETEPVSGFRHEAVLAADSLAETGVVPGVRVRLGREPGIHDRFGGDAREIEDIFALVLSFQNPAPESVDRDPLLVHDVVVFEQVLPV